MKETKINLGMTPATSLIDAAKTDMDSWGKTDLYSTGDQILDEYLGNSFEGGYGRNGYEIITIFGNTGCISGEAEVPFKSQYLNGSKKIKLKNLYRRFHGLPYTGWHSAHTGETILVRSNSDSNFPRWVEVADVLDKGVRPVLKITAGGRSVVATPDHKFLTADGWVELQQLKPGDTVAMAPRYSKKRGGKKGQRQHIVYTKYHPTNRPTMVGGRYKYHIGTEHRLAYEAIMNHLSYDDYLDVLNHYDGRELWTIPDGMEVHHKDGDHYNNSPDNLELLSKRDHALLGVEQSLDNFDYSNVLVKIDSIVPAGEQHVYDISCKGIHDFVANGFCVHNCNKSTFATTIILEPARKGTKIAYFALEDDPKDVVRRILVMCNMDEEKTREITNNILFMPESDGYTLDAMADAIEKIFDVADIVVVDPLQFIFEASVAEKGETEFNRQRLFMRRMNNIMKHTNKTLIIVSHTGKSGGGKDSKQGVDRIIGSSAIAQVSTKVIEINRKEDGLHGIRLWKTRFTPYRFCGVQIRLDNMKVRTVYELKDLPQARRLWSGEAR